jgi:hypothetical protein
MKLLYGVQLGSNKMGIAEEKKNCVVAVTVLFPDNDMLNY